MSFATYWEPRKMKLLTAFIIGGIFGLGIALSGMANPAKVLNFFDVAGTFDPSLIFVMGSAMLTAMIGYKIVFHLTFKSRSWKSSSLFRPVG